MPAWIRPTVAALEAPPVPKIPAFLPFKSAFLGKAAQKP